MFASDISTFSLPGHLEVAHPGSLRGQQIFPVGFNPLRVMSPKFAVHFIPLHYDRCQGIHSQAFEEVFRPRSDTDDKKTLPSAQEVFGILRRGKKEFHFFALFIFLSFPFRGE
jgi:hypothetical protein